MMSGHSIKPFRPGIYRHYKGNKYHAYDIAEHSENREKYVVYRCLYGDRGLWIRPLSMFLEKIELNGVEVARFEWLGPAVSDLGEVND